MSSQSNGKKRVHKTLSKRPLFHDDIPYLRAIANETYFQRLHLLISKCVRMQINQILSRENAKRSSIALLHQYTPVPPTRSCSDTL